MTNAAHDPLGPGPVSAKARIFTLDVLRGWAILGILAVNAMAFAWPMALSMGEMSGLAPPYPHNAANIRGDWAVNVFFEDKFRSLFSMLFGVSVFLIGGERDSDRGPILVRRLLWLGLFGLIHGALFWAGDILLHYAYCGLIVMMMRSWSARRLIWVGASLNLVFALLSALTMWAMGAMQAGGEMAGGAGSSPFAVTEAQVAAAIEAYRAGGLAPLVENLKAWLMMQSASLFLIPITAGLMLLGMGLFKAGFLSGRSPTGLYLALVAVAALNLAAFAWFDWMDAATPPGAADPSRGLSGLLGSFAPLITLGYASLLILLAKAARPAVAWLAPVGRMAFTNYLTQTLIMTSIFYMPWGPRLFGQADYVQMWGLVLAIWALQLIWSPLWLSRFSMGPLEWVWRCLTYGRRVPISKGG